MDCDDPSPKYQLSPCLAGGRHARQRKKRLQRSPSAECLGVHGRGFRRARGINE